MPGSMSVKECLEKSLAGSWAKTGDDRLRQCEKCDRHEPEHDDACPWALVEEAIEGLDALKEGIEASTRAAREKLQAAAKDLEHERSLLRGAKSKIDEQTGEMITLDEKLNDALKRAEAAEKAPGPMNLDLLTKNGELGAQAVEALVARDEAISARDAALIDLSNATDEKRETLIATLIRERDEARRAAGAYETAADDRHILCEMGRHLADHRLLGKHDNYAASAVFRAVQKALGEKIQAEGKLIEETAEHEKLKTAHRKALPEFEATKKMLSDLRAALEQEILGRADALKGVETALAEVKVARSDAAGMQQAITKTAAERERAREARDGFIRLIKGIGASRGEWLTREGKDGVAPEIGEAIDKAGEAVERFEAADTEMTETMIKASEEEAITATREREESERRLRGCQAEFREQRARADAAERDVRTMVAAVGVVTKTWESQERNRCVTMAAAEERETGKR